MATVRALADPAKMIRNGAPCLIQNDEELEHYDSVLLKLLEIAEPSNEESAAIDLLTLLIENYDAVHHAIPNADPIAVIRFMMSQHGLQQKDLVPEFGTKSIVSEVLSGKRKLTLEHIQRLSRRFHVSPLAFFSERTKTSGSTRRSRAATLAPARKLARKHDSKVA